MAKYKTHTVNCLNCEKEFSRSAPIDKPPKHCCIDCRSQANIGVSYEKYVIPGHWMPIIRKTYLDETPDRGKIARLAKKIGVPRTKLSNIARSNGWIPVKMAGDYHRAWCDREDEIVIRNGHCAVITTRRRLKKYGYIRSISAIECRRAKLRAVSYSEGMSAKALADCMGIDSHVILKAIKAGKLKAKRKEGYEGEKVDWFIMPKSVREYIKTWLPEIDIRKCEKFWLVDMLTGADDA